MGEALRSFAPGAIALLLLFGVVIFDRTFVIEDIAPSNYVFGMIGEAFAVWGRFVWGECLLEIRSSEEGRTKSLDYLLGWRSGQRVIRNVNRYYDAADLEKNGPVCHPVGNGMEMCIQASPQPIDSLPPDAAPTSSEGGSQ